MRRYKNKGCGFEDCSFYVKTLGYGFGQVVARFLFVCVRGCVLGHRLCM